MRDVIQGQGWLALEHIWMSYLFWLDDDAWATIEPHLPRNQPGARRVDDRRVISGIIHVLKSGCRWRDCPPEYGPYTTVYNRFNRWSRRLIWQRILQVLVGAGHLGESLSIDSTYGKAHRSAAGAVRRTGDASAVAVNVHALIRDRHDDGDRTDRRALRVPSELAGLEFVDFLDQDLREGAPAAEGSRGKGHRPDGSKS
jgi:transposase